MTFKTIAAAAVAVAVSGGSASAMTYDFMSAANAGGGIGESAFDLFFTDDFADWAAGPNLRIRAVDDEVGGTDWVYFDARNAGIGVCGMLNDDATPNVFTNSGDNQCNPSGDDGITNTVESLFFRAVERDTQIHSIAVNANHDGKDPSTTNWMINGVEYDLSGMTKNARGEIVINLGFTLGVGDFFSIRSTGGSPNAYVSAITVGEVPVPAAGFLLLAGLGGLAAVKRRKS